jgi:hypothetical protein
MYFFKRGGWQVQFLEADLKTRLPRKLTFSDPEKIRELADAGACDRDWERRSLSQAYARAVREAETAWEVDSERRRILTRV